MVYTPKTWADGELITAEDLNRVEQGIGGKVDMADARLSDARTPLAHTHADLVARLATLERDTGWRDITALLENGWLATQVRIRRVGPNVYFSHLGLDGRSRTGSRFLTLPAAFVPLMSLIPFAHTNGVLCALVNGTGGIDPPTAIYNAAPNTYSSGESSWGVPSAAWPTTLPGTPA